MRCPSDRQLPGGELPCAFEGTGGLLDWQEWLNLGLRWIHLIAGIAWIGSSFYFVWLDRHLTAPSPPAPGVVGEIWMVHSGGFYQVHRRKLGPGEVPADLHWFKWEAAITWITGMMLLAVVYYWTRGLYLIDVPSSRLSPAAVAGIGLAAIVLSWFAYDFIWRSSSPRATMPAVVVSAVLLAAVAYGLCRVMNGRAAFLHLGSLLGTLMVANVWLRILPAQQCMIDATREGRPPDWGLGERAKLRSLHNSYMTFPVLFLMLSNHFPAVYAHPLNWLLLGLVIMIGIGTRHLMIGEGRARALAAVPVLAATVALVTIATPHRTGGWTYGRGGEPVPYASVKRVVTARCISCHSATPAINLFGPSPGGVAFDRDQDVHRFAPRIRVRVVETKTMPLGNLTWMTEDERELIGRWVAQGARLE